MCQKICRDRIKIMEFIQVSLYTGDLYFHRFSVLNIYGFVINEHLIIFLKILILRK